MSENKLQQVYDLGQSIWCDSFSRELLNSGTVEELVEQGVRGMTSNPKMFHQAIADSDAYDEQIRALADRGLTVKEIYETLAVADIQQAADLLQPVYERTDGTDGFISLEVSPLLSHDTDATIEEAHHLWERVDRPNLMIKIPATEAGIPAVQACLIDGININITLIFGLEMYQRVIEAHLSALEQRIANNRPVDSVASVASFFVSRVDVLVDHVLDERIEDVSSHEERLKLRKLKGKAAVANARMAYQMFKGVVTTPRFGRIEEAGGRAQRPLWASTSTKHPEYSDVRYVESLIGARTVNTTPLETLDAFLDHGEVAQTIEDNLDEAEALPRTLAKVGIDMDEVTDQLLKEGVDKFVRPFELLLEAIAAARKDAVKGE